MKMTFHLLIAFLLAMVFINPSCRPTDYSSDINALKLKCDSLAAELEITNANLEATNVLLENLSSTITSIQGQLIIISEQIAKLNFQLSITQAIVSIHAFDLGLVYNEIAAIQRQITLLNSQQAVTGSAVTNLSTTTSAVQILLTSVITKVDSLNSQQLSTSESLSELSESLNLSNIHLINLSSQFSTLLNQLGMVIDYEGNIYHTVTIGKQIWLAENLRSTKFQNGESIPYSNDIKSMGYCWYNDGVGYKDSYGALYNYAAITDVRNICPPGWHIPTSTEWKTLNDMLGGNSIAGGKLKESGTIHWFSPNVGAYNTLGFSALPGGVRNCAGNYNNMGIQAQFWTSSPGEVGNIKVISLYQLTTQLNLENIADCNSVSVRCVKDK